MGLETQPLPEGSAPTDASEAAPLDDWPTPAAPASELPPIAAKADDLEAIKKAVEQYKEARTHQEAIERYTPELRHAE